MPEDPAALVCRLDALTPDERTRRADLAARLQARFVEVVETGDGYAARLDDARAVAHEATEWLLLERRCCPFLRLELVLEPAAESLWLRFGGGAGVKGFLAAAGLRPRAAHASSCGC
jgi:hypothetical protein